MFKAFKAGEYLNGGFACVNVLMIIASANAGIPIPAGIFLCTGLACIAWFACAEGIERVQAKHKLDDKGNPKRKDNDKG